ncbi:PilZ domain-containing protein [Bacillus piscicola]|uniref:PilZ domain-containing protein n=1 Tax=Bacillus piscicola TaxID=1632684 RepID=UPI001F090253|nr:PilZ domain-containing protein [Bacillus piscicola]
MYRRDEGFRVTFQEPLSASFTILKLKGQDVEHKTGKLHIIDMSLKGAKVVSPLNLPADGTELLLEFVLDKNPVSAIGELVWKKGSYQRFTYGVKLNPDTYSDRQLFTELKQYVHHHKSQK